ncbi:hypothetical protein CAOG_00450 [Capsaspora owczarzaki ATCC 30864]|uniref:C2H2-type domain-containing protein n=1 Tax=Capsaspora owczarzaki (strain ATCC 30864) TaxID=595528 RepID=A0A0D2VG84_CAPO3|nr:hypothetical protein CAOG_00450 [Capsaspora owczarzaki ATCC 30864]KJE88877.1 hypothetical protein CAOG_000450 [Capsaspora owczarzaki ATCC 30864]|eukprot:XP_004365321.2 hypothetical protein CAOG_00450 [Capsaspora owczarzaki ATCC 30864]
MAPQPPTTGGAGLSSSSPAGSAAMLSPIEAAAALLPQRIVLHASGSNAGSPAATLLQAWLPAGTTQYSLLEPLTPTPLSLHNPPSLGKNIAAMAATNNLIALLARGAASNASSLSATSSPTRIGAKSLALLAGTPGISSAGSAVAGLRSPPAAQQQLASSSSSSSTPVTSPAPSPQRAGASLFCTVCRKKFGSEATYSTHMSSKHPTGGPAAASLASAASPKGGRVLQMPSPPSPSPAGPTTPTKEALRSASSSAASPGSPAPTILSRTAQSPATAPSDEPALGEALLDQRKGLSRLSAGDLETAVRLLHSSSLVFAQRGWISDAATCIGALLSLPVTTSLPDSRFAYLVQLARAFAPCDFQLASCLYRGALQQLVPDVLIERLLAITAQNTSLDQVLEVAASGYQAIVPSALTGLDVNAALAEIGSFLSLCEVHPVSVAIMHMQLAASKLERRWTKVHSTAAALGQIYKLNGGAAGGARSSVSPVVDWPVRSLQLQLVAFEASLDQQCLASAGLSLLNALLQAVTLHDSVAAHDIVTSRSEAWFARRPSALVNPDQRLVDQLSECLSFLHFLMEQAVTSFGSLDCLTSSSVRDEASVLTTRLECAIDHAVGLSNEPYAEQFRVTVRRNQATPTDILIVLSNAIAGGAM